MTTPRVYNTEAIVLKRTKLGEADRILTLYTPRLGKFRAVAKGVRRSKSKLGGHVELLTYSTMMLARGRNLDIITQSQTIDSFLPLRDDLWRISRAIYVADLVDCFTAEQVENYPIFKLLLDTLHRLCQTPNGNLPLRYFELHIFTHLGYRPKLRQCLGCNSPLQPTTNFFSASGGGILCPKCRDRDPLARPISVNALKVMRFFQDSDYSSASRLKIGADLARELELLMREYIRYLLEYEVKSAIWLDRLREESG
jgi:DNA repair protein RecO (recombination protein O)